MSSPPLVREDGIQHKRGERTVHSHHWRDEVGLGMDGAGEEGLVMGKMKQFKSDCFMFPNN